MAVNDLVFAGFDEGLTFTIFLLEHQIDTFQRFGLKLIDNVVQDLEASDLDNAVVIW